MPGSCWRNRQPLACQDAPGLSARAGRLVVDLCFVQLRVSEGEQERRVADPSRTEFHKIASVPVLRQVAGQPTGEQPPADLVIDTDTTAPEDSAALIAASFQLPQQVPENRYPP